jgi:malonyl-CoA decarboxylase
MGMTGQIFSSRLRSTESSELILRNGETGLAEASTEQLAPPLNRPRSEPAGDQSSLVGRALSRWTRAIRDIAASARLPFASSDDPDLGADAADRLRAEMRACLEARGGEVLARARAAGIASVYLGLSQAGRARFFEILATEFGVERAEAERATARYQAATGEADKLAAERALRRALVSPGMRLLTKFNALPEGTRF